MAKQTKIIVTFSGILFLCLLIGWISYDIFGHQLIEAMYEGRSIGFLNKIIEGQATTPVEFYFNKANSLFLCVNIIFCIMILIYFSARTEKNIILIAILSLILILIGIFYVTTIREGHNWGGDFSMYIRHAKNISEGIAYGETGNIRHHSDVGSEMYPPVFPLLLSPTYKCFGLNLSAMKIEIILLFLFALFIMYKVFKDQMLLRYPVLLIAVFGINPYFWDFKDNVLSDIPFLFFIYLSIFLVNKIYLSSSFSKNKIPNIILVSILFYLCYATRISGIIFIPSLFIYDLIKSRRITSFPIKVTLLFLLFAILQKVFFGINSNYSGTLGLFSSRIILDSLFYYYKMLLIFWNNGYSIVATNILFWIMTITAIIGYFTSVKKRITICEIFFLLYVSGIILSTWRQGIRYLIPIIPLYLFYSFIGVNHIALNVLRHKRKFTLVALSLFIFVTYIAKYTTVNWSPIQDGIGKKETIELFNYIKKKTDKKDIFIFCKPRVLALFTERRTSGYLLHNDEKNWEHIQAINATHVIASPIDVPYISNFIKRYKNNLQKIYANPDFAIYRIKK